MNNLDFRMVKSAVTMPVTTRAIGFSTLNVFKSIYGLDTSDPAPACRGTIYQLYRVALAAFEAKVQLARRGVTLPLYHEDDYAQLRQVNDWTIQAATCQPWPDQLSLVLDGVGQVRVKHVLYVPGIGRPHHTSSGKLVPQSEQVCWSNLRDTVESLADPGLPRQLRADFHANSPLPGAVWQLHPESGPLLLNPDEIMPPDCNVLERDVEQVAPMLRYLQRKAPEQFRRAERPEPQARGSQSMFVCSEQGGAMRCQERQPGQALDDYCRSMRLLGDIEHLYSLVSLTGREQVEGSLALLGESPVSPARAYPVYVQRDPRNCPFLSRLSYKLARACLSSNQ